MDVEVDVFKGRSNTFSLFLVRQGVPLSDAEMGAITRVVLNIDGTDYDSDVLGATKIWLTDTATWQVNQTYYIVTFALGAEAGLAVGKYRDCQLRTYDADNPSGLVWPTPITVNVY